MTDVTENARKSLVNNINSAVESDDKDSERARLEKTYGQIWDTNEMTTEFSTVGFMAPFIVVKRKSDGVKGSLEFQGSPRFYFNFKESN